MVSAPPVMFLRRDPSVSLIPVKRSPTSVLGDGSASASEVLVETRESLSLDHANVDGRRYCGLEPGNAVQVLNL